MFEKVKKRDPKVAQASSRSQSERVYNHIIQTE